MKTYTPWKQQDSRIIVASDRVFRAPEKWEWRVKIECDLFGDWQDSQGEGILHSDDGQVIYFDNGEWSMDRMGDSARRFATIHDLRRRVFSIIDRSPATFMAVTKEPGRVRENWPRFGHCQPCGGTGLHASSAGFSGSTCGNCHGSGDEMFRFNLHLFAECHNQATVDARVPELLKCRDLSPSIGIWFRGLSEEVDITPFIGGRLYRCPCGYHRTENELIFCGGGDYTCPTCMKHCEIEQSLDTIVIEGGSTPMHPDWVRSLISQCEAAGVKVVFESWGDWVTAEIRTPSEFMAMEHKQWTWLDRNGESGFTFGTKDRACMVKVGRAASGRMLDGKLWGWE